MAGFRAATGAVILIASSLFWLAPASAQQSPTGLYGTVTRSPTSPVCAAERPCSAPVAGAILQALRGQTIVAHTKTGRKGRYRLRLSPGRYAIRVVGLRGGGKTTSVRAHGWTHLDLTFDTGIR
jgi:hypothetical protein